MPRMTSRLSPVQSVRLRQLAVTCTLRGGCRYLYGSCRHSTRTAGARRRSLLVGVRTGPCTACSNGSEDARFRTRLLGARSVAV